MFVSVLELEDKLDEIVEEEYGVRECAAPAFGSGRSVSYIDPGPGGALRDIASCGHQGH